jgi:replicative DNA helicase
MSNAVPMLQVVDEQTVLGCLLWHPVQHAFELAELSPDLFQVRANQQIAQVMCSLRDAGVRVHWRRVRRILRSAYLFEAAGLVEPLVKATGSSHCVGVYLSRLIYRRANPRARYVS